MFMKKTFVLIGMCLSTIIFTQCAKKATSTKTSATTVDEVAELTKKYNPSQMAEGKAVFVGSCQKCHQLYQPAEFTIKKWNKILPDMSHKAELNANQAGLVRAWVITNAKQS